MFNVVYVVNERKSLETSKKKTICLSVNFNKIELIELIFIFIFFNIR